AGVAATGVVRASWGEGHGTAAWASGILRARWNGHGANYSYGGKHTTQLLHGFSPCKLLFKSVMREDPVGVTRGLWSQTLRCIESYYYSTTRARLPARCPLLAYARELSESPRAMIFGRN